MFSLEQGEERCFVAWRLPKAMIMNVDTVTLNRRHLLISAMGAAAASTIGKPVYAESPAQKKTDFQLACMTLPYAAVPFKRALTGIKSAGFRYVAWGTSHQETPGGERVPVMAADSAPGKAKELAKLCRDMGLEPLMMFSTVYPEAADGLKVLTNRIKQAGAAAIPQVLTFGHTSGGKRDVWIERLTQLGPIAGDHGVVLVVKQHGGSTGTGEACAEIIREVNHPNIKVNYDAGNVMDYLDVDPIPDIIQCAQEVFSFCIKDHRNWPVDQDCGPGFGEIDHYRLLHPVAFTGRSMPLCFENISAPLLPKPTQPESIDVLARRAREFVETVVSGLQSPIA